MKIQLKQWIVYLLILSCGLTSCSDDETATENVLDVNTEAVMFTEKASTKKVIVSAKQEWTAEVPEETNWCTVKQVGDELEITVTENTEVKVRTTVLTVRSQGQEKQISVKQAGITPHILIVLKEGQKGIELTGRELELDKDVTNCHLKVLATVGYEVVIEENTNWIKVTPGIRAAEEETTLSFEVQPNESGENRRTEVLFKQTEGDYYTYLSVTQKAQ